MANFNPNFVQQVGSQTQNRGKQDSFSHLIARVTHVVQGPNLVGTNIPDIYYNDPTDLGTITFQLLNSPQSSTLSSDGNNVAKPINSALKQYPIEGEFVNIIPGPGVGMNESRGQRDFFYSAPYNLWNATNHNALPDLGDYGDYINTVQRNYQDSANTNQAVNTSATGSLVFPLGPNFPEKNDVKTLRQFTGDVTLEGRWGNSIRFGSTTAVDGNENYWSSTGDPGTPITIIRNGQGKQVDNIPWVPTVENINRDPSSIYLTAGQKVVIDDITNNFSLSSLGVQIQSTQTNAIPIQQQLTSTDTISSIKQDQRISNIS